jgi:pSer/pThr/pTyr-binding forkhead associated (FHA) protein
VQPVIEAFRTGIAQSRVTPPTPQKVPKYIADPTPPDPDETVQLLPGRLEPLTEGLEQEIRFVKIAGLTRFTFGRSPGPAHSHIQLRARTASRMHGYMMMQNGRWHIGNLSETNSVVVNGTRLAVGAAEQQLKDGDRIEFGEVAFVFHER